MINVYDPREINFSHNGYGVVSALKAEVTEELNGMFELELVCTLGNNYNVVDYISEAYIIRADTPIGKQLFRIYAVHKTLNNQIRVNARHISYDLMFCVLDNVTEKNYSADQSIKKIVGNVNTVNKFNASSDISEYVLRDIEFVDTNVIAAILGENGLTTLFGGELYRDNFNIELRTSRAENRGFEVRYRKNLTGLDIEISIDDMVTRIKPLARSADGQALYLPEVYIDSSNIDNYFMPITQVMDMNDIRVGSDEFPDNTAVFDEMRSRVSSFYASGYDKPKVNAKVSFILLKNTEEYREFAPLENIFLGDYVDVFYEKLNINLKAKCIKYTYDSIAGRYKSIEVGSFRNDFAVSTSSDISQLSVKSATVNVDEQLLLLKNQVSLLEQKVKTHKHNEEDGTARVSYNDLTDTLD